MKIADSIALIAGGKRGIGRAYAHAFLAGSSCKGHAVACDSLRVTLPGALQPWLNVNSRGEVESVLDALEAGVPEAVADELIRLVMRGRSVDPVIYPAIDLAAH